MGIGAIIIGDEILSGKRADKHFARLIDILHARGMALDWCQYLGDERSRLVTLLELTLGGADIVFSFGGIGMTPDDHTRQAVATALGVPLLLHPEAEREIRGRFGEQTTPQRLMLGEFPSNAAIVPNPYNRIPGFAVRDHYFLPGFPEMAWPMTEWVLDTHYAHLHHRQPRAEAAMLVFGGSESALLDLMHRIEAEYPGVKVFSLPCVGGAGVRQHIELGVRGHPEQVTPAMTLLRDEVTRRGLEWEGRQER